MVPHPEENEWHGQPARRLDPPDLFGRIGGERAKPFLKWAGGKSRLLPELRRYVPRGYARYIEPFLGGGAFFFDLAPESAILGDANPGLITCYEAVRDEPANVLSALSEFRVTEKDYYRVSAWNQKIGPDGPRGAPHKPVHHHAPGAALLV